MKKIIKYMRGKRGEIARIARAAKVSGAQMSRILSGKRGASLQVALAIERATAGEITVADISRAKPAAKGHAKGHRT